MKRVTGLGGVFFKSEEPKKLREWYGKHLGLAMEDWGSTFFWIDPNNPEAKEKDERYGVLSKKIRPISIQALNPICSITALKILTSC